MKNKTMNMLQVRPRGVVPHANGEAARAGEAVRTVNLREQEQSLQVTGLPQPVAAIGVDERLLTMHDGYIVTCRNNGTLLIDGQQVTQLDSGIVGAHAIGELMVIVTRDALSYLLPDGDGWLVLDPADAVPQLSFSVNTAVSRAEISSVTFSEPYSQWALRCPMPTARPILACCGRRGTRCRAMPEPKGGTRRRCWCAGPCACMTTATCG